MSEVVLLKCLGCDAYLSGVRTEFGSLVVPGYEGCPQCGSGEFAEASTTEGETRPDAATRTRTED